MVRFLLFDMDGTLFYTKSANTKAYQAAFKAAGEEFDGARYESAFGLGFHDMMSFVAPYVPVSKYAEIKKVKDEKYVQFFDEITRNETLISLIDDLKGKYKIALVTTARQNNVYRILQHFNMSETFDIVVTGEDVSKAKPDPEVYNYCMDQLGALPDECLVFEDSEYGIKAAENAGIKVLRV